MMVELQHMITTILSDFSHVILNQKDKNYTGTLNALHAKLSGKVTDYLFFDYFEFNNEILNVYRKMKTKYFMNIFTTGTIQNRPEVRLVIDSIFENIYSAIDFNLDKKQLDAYLFIANKLNRNPTEILFVDDQIENINAAKQAGLHTIQYVTFEKTALELDNYLDKNKS